MRAQHETASRHVPFPPILLHACLLISNTSPAAFAKMESMFDGALPVPRTLRGYNDTGDYYTSGVNPTLYRKIADYVSACGATGESLHCVLSCDELSTIDVCALPCVLYFFVRLPLAVRTGVVVYVIFYNY